MGALDFLFGESPSATPISQPTGTAEQQAALKQLLAQLGGGAAQPEGAIGTFQGELSNLENLSLQGFEELFSGGPQQEVPTGSGEVRD